MLVLEAADFERDVRLLQELKVGELRVGSGVYPAELSLGTAMGRLAARHPGLRIDVTTGDWRDTISALQTGQVDLVVVELSVLKGDQRLVVEALPEHAGVFFCRTGHPLLSEKNLTLERIFEFPFVGPKLAPRVATVLSQMLRQPELEQGTGDYLPSIKVDTVGLAKDAVAASDAISVAPATAITDSVAMGRLAPLPVRPPWLYTAYGFAWLKNRSLSPAAQAFMAEMRAVETQLATAETHLLEAMFPSSEAAAVRRMPVRVAGGRRR